MVELLHKVGKVPVVLRKEATGFVGNRLQFALFREVLAIVEQGIAGPEAVDQVVQVRLREKARGGGTVRGLRPGRPRHHRRRRGGDLPRACRRPSPPASGCRTS